MEVTIVQPEQLGGSGVWRWARPLDITMAREFHTWARARMRPGEKGSLIMDLSETAHIDASGLQILVALAVEAMNRGRLFEITAASNQVKRDLELAGIGYLMRQE